MSAVVLKLVAEAKIILACDVWMCACLGLRANDIQRIMFCKEDEYICSIKILEKKNRNVTFRYVPSSLVNLIKKTETSYPLGARRMQEARRFCLREFQCFYSFRHECITNLLACLHKGSYYAQLHRNPKTTRTYYLNENNKRFIDTVFHLGPDYEETNPTRNLLLDLTGTQ